MAGILLRRLVVGAGLLALGGCAYATPYPAAFPETNGPQMAPADSGRSDGCDMATTTPGLSSAVLFCLRSRGQAWDNRGRAIRRQAGYAGQLSIPLGITTLGLSAAGDTSDFVPLSTGVSSATLAHTGAYARPGQAEVYELATDAYRCLIRAVGRWNGEGASTVASAFDRLEEQNAIALRAVDTDPALTAADRRGLGAKIRLQVETARLTANTLDADIGNTILQQSDEVETAVIRAIRLQLPDPQAVSASIGRGSGATAAPTPGIPLDTEQALAAGKTRGRGFESNNATARDRALAEIEELIADADAARDVFDATVTAYSTTRRQVTTACVFNPSQVQGLSVSSETVELDSGGGGSFVARNGVPPYGYLPLPTGVTVAISPINASSAHFRVTAPVANGAGPWQMQVIDAAGGLSEVSLTKVAP